MTSKVIAPETAAREALITAIKTEFASEGYPVRDDKLHGSIGSEGTVIACYPIRSDIERIAIVQRSEIMVQYYGKWDKRVDPDQTVSPKPVEQAAERFRRSIQSGVDPQTGDVWYFQWIRTDYPDDPTGNKTRFEARVIARGNNNSLLETA